MLEISNPETMDTEHGAAGKIFLNPLNIPDWTEVRKAGSFESPPRIRMKGRREGARAGRRAVCWQQCRANGLANIEIDSTLRAALLLGDAASCAVA